MNLFELYELVKEEKKQVPIGSVWEYSDNSFSFGNIHIVGHSIINRAISGRHTLYVQYEIRPLLPTRPVHTGLQSSAKNLIESEWRMISP